jgi:hypothetical protein
MPFYTDGFSDVDVTNVTNVAQVSRSIEGVANTKTARDGYFGDILAISVERLGIP